MGMNYFISGGSSQFKGVLPIFASDDPKGSKAYVKFGLPQEWRPNLIFGGVPAIIGNSRTIQHAISLESFPIIDSMMDKRAMTNIERQLFSWLIEVPNLRKTSTGYCGGAGAWLWSTEYVVAGYEGSVQCCIIPQGKSGKAVLVAQIIESSPPK